MSELCPPIKSLLSIDESSVLFHLTLMTCADHPEQMQDTALRFIQIWIDHQPALAEEVA